MSEKAYCDVCYGKGTLGKNACLTCNGTGLIPAEEDAPSAAQTPGWTAEQVEAVARELALSHAKDGLARDFTMQLYSREERERVVLDVAKRHAERHWTAFQDQARRALAAAGVK